MLLSLINYAINLRVQNVNARITQVYGTAKKFKFPLLNVTQIKSCAAIDFLYFPHAARQQHSCVLRRA